MKLAFDGDLILKPNKTGIAWNAHHLLMELVKYPENECTLQYFNSHAAHRIRMYEQAGFQTDCCGWMGASMYKMLQMPLSLPYAFFFPKQSDITQFFNFVIPPGVRGKRVVWIHDMAYKSCPQAVKRKTRLWLEMNMKKTCMYADHILTVSRFSKKEMLRYLPVSKERISVIPNAVDHSVYHTGYSGRQIQTVKDIYGIEKEYFLYLGTIEPRKNLMRLIGAYERLCQKRKHVPQLVLAGGKGWMCRDIYRKADLSAYRHKIRFTGYVSQKDSPILMCAAKAFVFPSLYEGFGMPPLEAMACGTPVITSNTTSLPEVVGNAGIKVNPESEDEICQAMLHMLEHSAYSEKLTELGLKRAANYTWEKSAGLLQEVYRKLMKEN